MTIGLTGSIYSIIGEFGGMHFARTIMAFLIALSVALLPTAGSAAIDAKSSEHGAPAKMHMHSDMSVMDDCCPDQPKPCGQNSDHCRSMASCAVQSVSIAGVAVSHIRFPMIAGNPLPILTDQAVTLYDGSPPFRPPRV